MKKDVLATYRVGRKIVAHIFKKHDQYMWSGGSPTDNPYLLGFPYLKLEHTRNAAEQYVTSFAEYMGRNKVTVHYSNGKHVIMRLNNNKWTRKTAA